VDHRRSPRRGSYAALFALSMTAFIGFGALAVDIALLRLADAEIQAVADAAAQAGVLELRRTNDRDIATDIAQQVITGNRVAGLAPETDRLQFGVYEAGVFAPHGGLANALSVRVEATLDLPFSSFWGSGLQTLGATATAAARPLHTVVVVDITNSWSLSNFNQAREGVLAVFDRVTATSSTADRIGCVVFHGKFGTEFTPLMLVDDAIADGVRDDWAAMSTASKGSEGDGKYSPWMPLEFPDETGTDHAIGIQMATKMFSEVDDPSVYRAMIVVTDGQPADVGRHEDRAEDGYVEERWRYEYTGEEARTVDEIKIESVAYAQAAWDLAEVSTWMVSYKQSGQWMEDTAQGDGYFIRTNSASDLVAIFADIAESLPVTLVE